MNPTAGLLAAVKALAKERVVPTPKAAAQTFGRLDPCFFGQRMHNAFPRTNVVGVVPARELGYP